MTHISHISHISLLSSLSHSRCRGCSYKPINRSTRRPEGGSPFRDPFTRYPILPCPVEKRHATRIQNKTVAYLKRECGGGEGKEKRGQKKRGQKRGYMRGGIRTWNHYDHFDSIRYTLAIHLTAPTLTLSFALSFLLLFSPFLPSLSSSPLSSRLYSPLFPALFSALYHDSTGQRLMAHSAGCSQSLDYR